MITQEQREHLDQVPALLEEVQRRLAAVYCLLMPGLPKLSRALAIDVDAQGEIIGMQ